MTARRAQRIARNSNCDYLPRRHSGHKKQVRFNCAEQRANAAIDPAIYNKNQFQYFYLFLRRERISSQALALYMESRHVVFHCKHRFRYFFSLGAGTGYAADAHPLHRAESGWQGHEAEKGLGAAGGDLSEPAIGGGLLRGPEFHKAQRL
jgi:hypothetical protein